MARSVVAILGSYRKGGTVDTAVDAVLAGAREGGAQTQKIYLVDRHIDYCHNGRTCTQMPGSERGKCVIEDDVPGILNAVDDADALILASPVNFFNVTAVFRTFLERLLGAVYWPWGAWTPKPRNRKLTRKAVLIASLGAPSIFLPLAARKALRTAATCLGARPVARLWIGLAAGSPEAHLSPRVLRRAQRIGREL